MIEKQLRLIDYVQESLICKEEPESHDETINFITTEALLSESIEQIPNEYTTEYLEDIEDEVTESIAIEERIKKEPKKFYKRALCGLCGNSYYKDQLQRHIDKVHHKVKRYFW